MWNDVYNAEGSRYSLQEFLGAYPQLRKATTSFSLAVRILQLASHWKDFHEMWYLNTFRKSVKKIRVSRNSDKYSGYFTCRTVSIYDTSLIFLLQWEIFQIKAVEKIKTHILCGTNFCSENRAVHEKMWKKYVRARQVTDDNITRRMRVACWITNVIRTHSE